MNNCPYKDKNVLPCDIIQHPDKDKECIFFCKICQQSYDVREIGRESGINPLIALILTIIMLFLGSQVLSEKPTPYTPVQENSSNTNQTVN